MGRSARRARSILVRRCGPTRQFPRQERPRDLPVALEGALGDGGELGDLGQRQPGEEAPPHESRQLGVDVVEVRTAPEYECLDGLLTGAAEVILVTRPLAPSERRKGIHERLLGHRLLAPVVNEANPVRSVRYADLVALLAGRIETWQPLGWDEVPVQPAVTQRFGAPDPELFLAGVLERAAVLRTGADVVAFVGNTPGALAIVPCGELAGVPRVRVLEVDEIAPGAETFARGAWRLGRSVHVVLDERDGARPDATLLVTAFAAFLRGQEAGQMIAERLIVPN